MICSTVNREFLNRPLLIRRTLLNEEDSGTQVTPPTYLLALPVACSAAGWFIPYQGKRVSRRIWKCDLTRFGRVWQSSCCC